MKLNTDTSIVDYLKSTGRDSTFANRGKIAQSYNIGNYKGTYNQNVKLLNLLKNGSKPASQNTATKPATKAPSQPAPAKPATPAPAKNTGTKGQLGGYMDELANYGMDLSKGYATKQAEAEAQALRDALVDAKRKNESSKQENVKAIDNNLMGTAEALDKDYYLQALDQMQNQANTGVNGGIAQEQDLRLAMARQSDMATAFRDANLGKMEANNTYTNNDLKYTEQLGTINQQAKANAEKMYQDNLQRGFSNALNQYQFDKGMSENRYQFDKSMEWEKSRFETEQEWRKHTFDNMSASEKAQLEQNASQFGEEMAWRMYEMEYSGTLQKSMLESELDAYGNFNEQVRGGGFDYSQYKISSPYGMRKDPFTGKSVMHKGVDLAMPKGAPVGATIGGTVVYAGMGQAGSGYGGYGNVVVVKDANGNLHQYSHLDNVKVKKGQTVNSGMVLGGAGSTGRSTGVHLEYMVKNSKGTAINPTGFLKGSHLSQQGGKSSSSAPGYKTYKTHMSEAIKRGVPSSWSTGMEWLVNKESTFNYNAKNPNSSAYGYGQFINSTRQAYEKKTGLSYNDPVNQLVMMAQYVKDRYGTPAKAIEHHKKKGWY